MTTERARHLAQNWANGGVNTVQEGEANKYHTLFLKMLLEQEKQSLPLTLDELRQMEGEPVWVQVIDHTIFCDTKDDFDGWGLCRKTWVRMWDANRADLVHVDWDFEDYGKLWLAYRKKQEGQYDYH